MAETIVITIIGLVATILITRYYYQLSVGTVYLFMFFKYSGCSQTWIQIPGKTFRLNFVIFK